jgi:hypothetical protein
MAQVQARSSAVLDFTGRLQSRLTLYSPASGGHLPQAGYYGGDG